MSDRMSDRDRDAEPADRRRGMERLGDLLPEAARGLGLEEELALARAMGAWDHLVSDLVPAAAGSCRLVGLERGVAAISADEPIVAQELRLRAVELLGRLRGDSGLPILDLRVTVRPV